MFVVSWIAEITPLIDAAEPASRASRIWASRRRKLAVSEGYRSNRSSCASRPGRGLVPSRSNADLISSSGKPSPSRATT